MLKHNDCDYLSVEQVARRYGITKVTVNNLLKLGYFPQPIRLIRRCLRWKRSMLDRLDAMSSETGLPFRDCIQAVHKEMQQRA